MPPRRLRSGAGGGESLPAQLAGRIGGVDSRGNRQTLSGPKLEAVVDDLIAQVARVSHFAQLPEVELRAIVGRGQVCRLQAGMVLFEEGLPTAGLFVLLAGRVHLRKLGPAGQPVIVSTLEPLIMLNEVAALDRGANPVTATAAESVRVWQIDADGLRALLLAHPPLALGLLQVLARRNRLLLGHLEDVSFRSVAARAARLLLDLSQEGRRDIDRRRQPNAELAARIATVPEALSRALQAFRRHGAISTTRTSIRVLDAQLLSRWEQGAPRM